MLPRYLLAVPGWLLLLLAYPCAPGCSWLLLAAHGCSWVLPGCLLDAPGFFLAASGCSWLLLLLLAALAGAGCSWLFLAAPACSCLLLAIPGCSRLLNKEKPGDTNEAAKEHHADTRKVPRNTQAAAKMDQQTPRRHRGFQIIVVCVQASAFCNEDERDRPLCLDGSDVTLTEFAACAPK